LNLPILPAWPASVEVFLAALPIAERESMSGEAFEAVQKMLMT
jgi:hypothetical protein